MKFIVVQFVFNLEKRALATRLEFDESFDGFQQPKIPKLSRDPFDSALGKP